MSNEKEDLDTEFAPQSSEGFNYKIPAIRIIERHGRREIELEFATAEDYAAYKRIEAEAVVVDKQKIVSVNNNNADKEKAKEIVKIIQNAIDSADIRCRRF